MNSISRLINRSGLRISHSKVFSSGGSDKFILHFIYPPWVRSEIETNDENNFINKVHFSSSKLCQFWFLGELEGNIGDKIIVEIKEEKNLKVYSIEKAFVIRFLCTVKSFFV